MKSREECLEVLGLADGASLEEIKAAFRKKALLYHPDTGNRTQDHLRFLLVRHSYETLVRLPARPSPAANLEPRPRPPSASPEPEVRFALGRKFNSLLWDMEELLTQIRSYHNNLRYRVKDAQRDLLSLLLGLDKGVLTPSGFPDYFMTARNLPDLDPDTYAAQILDRTASAHFPFSSLENYFFDLRKRMNKLLVRLETPHRFADSDAAEEDRFGRWLRIYADGVVGVDTIQRSLRNDQREQSAPVRIESEP